MRENQKLVFCSMTAGAAKIGRKKAKNDWLSLLTGVLS